MLESQIQRKIIAWLEKDGWYVIKIIQCNKNGMTDLIALRDGMAVFIEVKRPGEKPEELQLYRHQELRKKGFKVIIAASVNDCKAQL